MVLFTTEYQNILLITPIGVFLYNFVCCSFCRFFPRVFTGFFPLSWQKYFLPWQKTNPVNNNNNNTYLIG